MISLAQKLYGDNNGRGFFILRGLDPKKYDPTDNVIIYVGVSCYVAERRGTQDEKNNCLLHLTDLGATVAPDDVRQAPYSNVPQPFHTDTADLLALYTLQPAAQGGRSLLASSWRVYNSLASSHIDTLAKCNWAFDTFGRKPAYEMRPLLHAIPIESSTDGTPNAIPFNESNTRVLLSYSRRPLTGSPVSPRTPGIPALTTTQIDALDTVHFTAAAHSIAINLQAGDIQYWNNFALLHAREGFQDDAEQRRHLLRLWLRDENRTREWGGIPKECKLPWDEAFEGEGEEVWPIEPVREHGFVTEQRRSSGHA